MQTIMAQARKSDEATPHPVRQHSRNTALVCRAVPAGVRVQPARALASPSRATVSLFAAILLAIGFPLLGGPLLIYLIFKPRNPSHKQSSIRSDHAHPATPQDL